MFRRKFLKIAGLGAAAVALPSLGAYAVSLNEATAGIILHQFRFLNLDKEGVDQFVLDYYKQEGSSRSAFAHVKMRGYYMLNINSDQSQLVRTITTLYLLSTDFFQNRMNELKLVRYQGIYDPYKTPCANPFSALYYPPAPAV
ncbi:hypothetical protein MUN82_05585 [Hymenobacter aerilatus]|uniref:Twin-arginine translocation signal domain-containing protein n=1 Tax=Hymenobacter aerilatus TaxID=2932251 RepID=A0A8T9SXW6_9BACT|nr:hypothetical protein [Hymenobacter aerilatus]UOR06567.1 hypothetical protein MUN82_05585 [Hymenobacter aerilatus]